MSSDIDRRACVTTCTDSCRREWFILTLPRYAYPPNRREPDPGKLRGQLAWLTVIPALGAIVIPYFAVVFANGGREPSNTRGFMEYQPHVPATRDPAGPSSDNGRRPARPGSDDN